MFSGLGRGFDRVRTIRVGQEHHHVDVVAGHELPRVSVAFDPGILGDMGQKSVVRLRDGPELRLGQGLEVGYVVYRMKVVQADDADAQGLHGR